MRSEDQETVELFELIERMLEYDPERRCTLAQVLDHSFFDRLKPEEKLHRLHAMKSYSRDGKVSSRKKVIAHSASR